MFCVRDTTPGLPRLLVDRGFSVDRYRYLMRGLEDAAAPMPAPRVDCWQGHDHAMARLCEAAYRGGPGVRAFAPGGTPREWRQYIATLVEGTACGWFLPELSRIVNSTPREGGNLDASLMLTDLGTGVAHIAQLAVAPAARGRGLARCLIETALAEASRFYDHMSLLVSSSNIAAVRLYESLGFRDHASFTVASRPTS
jgi:GNAT superfamily N-acetyltransferase